MYTKICCMHRRGVLGCGMCVSVFRFIEGGCRKCNEMHLVVCTLWTTFMYVVILVPNKRHKRWKF